MAGATEGNHAPVVTLLFLPTTSRELNETGPADLLTNSTEEKNVQKKKKRENGLSPLGPNMQKVKKNSDFNRITQNVCMFPV